MATYLADSNVLIDVLTGRRRRPEVLRELLTAGHVLACCPVQVIEVYAGMRAGEETATEDLLNSLDYYEVTREIARAAGLFKRDYARRGKALSLADATIAAVALANDVTLITDNVRDYPMSAIRIHPLAP